MARDSFTMQGDVFQSAATKAASGNSEFALSTKSARTMEVWATISALTGTIIFSFDTTQDGTNYVSQKVSATLSSTGRYTYVLNRADHALGKAMRVSWTLSGGGSVTMDIAGLRME